MRWIDGHLDLAYLAVSGRDMRGVPADASAACVTLPTVRQGGIEIAFATIFTEPGVFGPDHPHGYPASDDLDAAEAAGRKQIEVYEQWHASGEATIARSAADLDASSSLPKLVILMEGADPIRSPEHVGGWRDRGLRIVGLTWAAGTRYAGGNSSGGPLTVRGREMVEALDAAGIIHDASHLSDEAFDGLMAAARGRVIASHSNCRALLDEKQRHLRDDQIKAIAGRNGVIGLNLYSAFLAKGRPATLADCIAHVEHVAGVMGHRRGVALGSDMDGGFTPVDLPVDLDHPAKLGVLAEGLRKVGWSDQDLAGFAYENWRRFLAEAWA